MTRILLILLLSLTAFGQPSPINRRAFAVSSLAKPNPLSLQFTNLALWIKSDYGVSNNTTGLTLTNGSVVNWWYPKTNQTYLGYTVNRFSPSPNPLATNYTAGPNGYPYVHTVSDQQDFWLQDVAAGGSDQPITVFLVARILGPKAGRSGGGIVSLNGNAVTIGIDTNRWIMDAGAIPGTTILVSGDGAGAFTNSFGILTVIYDNLNCLVRTNSVDVMAGVGGAGQMNSNFRWGVGLGSSFNTMSGDWVELRVYACRFSTNDFQSMESALKSYYGL